jgi:hypothetical protein
MPMRPAGRRARLRAGLAAVTGLAFYNGQIAFAVDPSPSADTDTRSPIKHVTPPGLGRDD